MDKEATPIEQRLEALTNWYRGIYVVLFFSLAINTTCLILLTGGTNPL